MNILLTPPIQCQRFGDDKRDEETMNNVALGCVKLVLDDPSIHNFEIKTRSANMLEQDKEEEKGKKECGWNSKGTGVFHPRNIYSQNILPKSHSGTGVFLGMPPINVNRKKNMLKKEKMVQTSSPKKKIEETKESFELFYDIYLPSEWPY